MSTSFSDPGLTPDRKVPMKVLVLGLPRTGTSSIKDALEMLGYHDVHHMAVAFNATKEENMIWVKAYDAKYGGIGKPLEKSDWDRATGKYMAVSDEPAASFPEELITAYPEAKVILTVRDNPQVWAKSFSETVWQRVKIAFVPTNIPILDFIRFNLLPRPRGMEVVMAWAKYRPFSRWPDVDGCALYEEHNANIRRLARKYERPFLEFNAKQGWEPLCEFLGHRVPETPYPHTLDRRAFMRETAMIRAVRFAVFTVELSILGAVVWYSSKAQKGEGFRRLLQSFMGSIKALVRAN